MYFKKNLECFIFCNHQTEGCDFCWLNFSEKFASFKKRSTDLPDTPKASNTSIHDVERGDTDSLSTIVNHPSGSGMTCAVDIKEVLIALHVSQVVTCSMNISLQSM